MDVRDLNDGQINSQNSGKKSSSRRIIIHYSIETYFIWFSALIFITELITDLCLVSYYFHENQLQWALVTLALIIVPLFMCQIYSIVLIKAEKRISMAVLLLHCLLLAIPHRYHNILRKIDKDKVNIQESELIKDKIREINAIQTVNAVLQYCPQFIFQAFLIIFRRYKCVITGVSAGLSGFSFLWHMFIHFYYLIKRYNEDYNFTDNGNQCNSNTLIIDNLSTSLTAENDRSLNSNASSSRSAVNLKENFKNFEKPLYNTDDKNFVPKKQNLKNVEKNKIFSFNKRRPIYKPDDDFDLYDLNQSTVFYEIDNSTLSSNKMTSPNKHLQNIVNENCANNMTIISTCLNNRMMTGSSLGLNKENVKNDIKLDRKLSSSSTDVFDDGIKDFYLIDKLTDKGSLHAINTVVSSTTAVPGETRNCFLKRKGICSSQEMLHLVDIMNDNISAEQVDIMAKSLIELGGNGDESLINPSLDSGDLDSTKLLDAFPDVVDESTQSSILENIDAAIYENQIIFRERIKKNQLTIQNLKLQDQILSSGIDVHDYPISNEMLSTRDYENMCVVNINRTNRGMKHWRNYLQDIDANIHDNSTVLNSSFFVNTISNNSCTGTDLYIHETESALADDGKSMSEKSNKCHGHDTGTNGNRKTVRWCNKVAIENYSCCGDENSSEDLYINMNPTNNNNNSNNNNSSLLLEKNILVETINKINVDSPIKHLTKNNSLSAGGFINSSSSTSSHNQMDSITESIDTFVEND